MGMGRHSTRVLFGALLVASLGGCGFFRRLAGNDTINLEKANVKSMSVDLRRQQKTICPREPVQMAVFMEVVLDGEKDGKQIETWAGKGSVNKNDKLEFTEFAFHSEQGSFDPDGWFSPNPDVLATAGKEFEIKSVFRKRPDKFTMNTTYKPDYACIKGAGAGGAPGSAGSAGGEGRPGQEGQGGSSSQAGGDGGDGSPGSGGGKGTDGSAGPRLTIYATMVKTPFYDRLVAIAVDGDKQDFLLVPDGAPVTLLATGGPGGPGGHGGHGGHGGSGGSGNPGGNGGRGAAGGHGGNGGNGGPGGQIELVYDARFPDLRAQLRLDVSGGPAGPAGHGGGPGGGGRGGTGITPPGSSGQSPPPAQSGKDGSAGSEGAGGAPGRPGPDGRATASPGNVKDKFAGRGEVTAL